MAARPGGYIAGVGRTARCGRPPPREIALRRLERAEALGMTYRDYTLEILEHGRHR